ncbi:MAG TPA: type II CAAX endopeptidase family protein [Planctomycetota bacterium]|nr:type II CAAX endopeptidase family protein [Planctomycetota bacterium]
MSDEVESDDGEDAFVERASLPPRHAWHADIDAAESIACRCPACGQSWSVHRDLTGYRVRCECGTFVTITAALSVPRQDALDLLTHSDALDGSVPRHEGLFAPPTAPREVALDSTLEAGALAEARNDVVVSWTSRTILELALMMAALVLPPLLVMILTSGSSSPVWLPLSSLISSLCVIAVGMFAPGYTFGSLKLAKPRYFVEAGGALIVALGFAFLWTFLWRMGRPISADDGGFLELRQELGPAMALFVVALCPGIFEELAFRGLLQGRLGALFGTTTALLVTGAAFAWAHGVTMGFPIHLSLGLYLCWLRARSESLIPGMCLHALYNGTIVLTT